MLDAITGTPALELQALDRLQALPGGHRFRACAEPAVVNPTLWGVPAFVAQWLPQSLVAALIGSPPTVEAPKPFPREFEVPFGSGSRQKDVKLRVPERRIHHLDTPALNLVVDALTSYWQFDKSETDSSFLARGKRISFSTTLATTEQRMDRGPANLRVHVEHRWGEVRACVVDDRASASSLSVVLFDPHPPLVSHPGPESVTSSAFMSRLPIKLWNNNISSQLSLCDRANLRAVGTAMRPFQAPLEARKPMVDCVNRLAQELRAAKPVLAIRELVAIREAFDTPSVSATDKEEILNRLRPGLELHADLAHSRTANMAAFNVLIEYWPRQAKALALTVLQERAKATATT